MVFHSIKFWNYENNYKINSYVRFEKSINYFWMHLHVMYIRTVGLFHTLKQDFVTEPQKGQFYMKSLKKETKYIYKYGNILKKNIYKPFHYISRALIWARSMPNPINCNDFSHLFIWYKKKAHTHKTRKNAVQKKHTHATNVQMVEYKLLYIGWKDVYCVCVNKKGETSINIHNCINFDLLVFDSLALSYILSYSAHIYTHTHTLDLPVKYLLLKINTSTIVFNLNNLVNDWS